MEVGEVLSLDGIFEQAEIREAANGKKYLTGVFYSKERDQSIGFKRWDYQYDKPIPLDYAYTISGIVQEFRGISEIHIDTIRQIKDVNYTEYMKSSEIAPIELWNKLYSIIEEVEARGNISSEVIKAVKIAYTKNKEDLLVCPAAKVVHHNYVGGLVDHIVEVVDYIIRQYGDRENDKFFTDTEYDLAILGALVHDIGKLDSYSYVGSEIIVSRQDATIGHLVKGALKFDLYFRQACEELELDEDERNYEQAEKLSHIILSHHKKLEWGSPVVPITKEAFIVHESDYRSTQNSIIHRVESEMESGEVSEKDFFLGSRFWKS